MRDAQLQDNGGRPGGTKRKIAFFAVGAAIFAIIYILRARGLV